MNGRAAAAVVALVLALAASPGMAADAVVFDLIAKDGVFQPSELRAPAGRKLKIKIRNEGDEPIEFESVSLRKEKVLGPGATSAVIIAPLDPGRYEFFDEFHPDTGRGFIVVE
jgi:plastocyanin